jgi:hypothetical protein
MYRLLLGSLVTSFVAVGGCGSPAPTVSGTVTIDGKPMDNDYSGWIKFEPLEGTPGPGGGATIKNGKYSIDRDMTVGKFRVMIYATRKTGRQIASSFLPVDFEDQREAAVDPEYNEESALEVKLGPGPNPYDFDVKERKKRSADRLRR